jgi:hypothetical protein
VLERHWVRAWTGVAVALCKAPKREVCRMLAAALDMPWRARAAAGRIRGGDGQVIAGKWERGWLAVVKDCEGKCEGVSVRDVEGGLSKGCDMRSVRRSVRRKEAEDWSERAVSR